MADARYDFVKAIFVKRVQSGVANGTKWVRVPYNLVKRGNQTGLEGNFPNPDKPGYTWDTQTGEEYDEVLMLDSWPTTWPSLGIDGTL